MAFAWKKWIAGCVLVAGSFSGFAVLTDPAVNEIRRALNQGRADDALQLLGTALDKNSNDAQALNLRCRVFFAERRWDEAIGSCEQAVKLDSGNSNYHLWLGRAYGEKADRVAFFTAYRMAKQIHAEFEQAVNLDGKNVEALADLGEYYIEAPSFLGGGYDKAEALAARLDSLSPEHAAAMRAGIAEQKKDYATAENLFKSRIGLGATSAADAWMDLGSFYRRRGRTDDMVAALKSGAVADHVHGVPLADGAATLMRAKVEPQLAIEWMKQYLASNATSEEAPPFVVHTRLATLLQQQGDQAGADREIAAAHALAKDFAGPAGKATNTGR
ncbi:tetratricopeptide repeat protein [Silvibacterium acidisoli]|uniref:tetratricopeptide repeat protein n=1 Tax=Acidobacteriaceae bacterium ZG23-2 TaxID=2883246 RepID=UPI00406C9F21